MAKRTLINPTTDKELKILSKKRKAEDNPIRTKIDILAELVSKAHKKECK